MVLGWTLLPVVRHRLFLGVLVGVWALNSHIREPQTILFLFQVSTDKARDYSFSTAPLTIQV